MAIKVVYEDESFNTEFEIGDLVEVKEDIKDIDGKDISSLNGVVIAIGQSYPISFLKVKSSDSSFEVYQRNVILLNDYSSQRIKKL